MLSDSSYLHTPWIPWICRQARRRVKSPPSTAMATCCGSCWPPRLSPTRRMPRAKRRCSWHRTRRWHGDLVTPQLNKQSRCFLLTPGSHYLDYLGILDASNIKEMRISMGVRYWLVFCSWLSMVTCTSTNKKKQVSKSHHLYAAEKMDVNGFFSPPLMGIWAALSIKDHQRNGNMIDKWWLIGYYRDL